MQRRSETADALWCGACDSMHPKVTFGRDKNSLSGFTYACKTVIVERNKIAHAKNKGANNRRHAMLRTQRKISPDRINWVIRHLLSDAKSRARQKGWEFNLHLNDIVPVARCPVFGCTLVYQADQRRRAESASLDRIDSRLGYITGNVWVISWRANQIKSDATADELRLVADAVDCRIGKKTAGSLLDGREHKAFPA